MLMAVLAGAVGLSLIGCGEKAQTQTSAAQESQIQDETKKAEESGFKVEDRREQNNYAISFYISVEDSINVEVLYKATYTAGAPGNWDAVGLLSEGGHNWIHSQICLDIDVPDELKLIGRFVECAMNGI